MRTERLIILVLVVFAATIFSTTAFPRSRSGEINMGDINPTDKKVKLLWNVNREITGFRVVVKKDKLIINTIKFIGTKNEWTVGRYFNAGQTWEKKLSSPTHVGTLRVNVDKAKGNTVGLIVYTKGSSSSSNSSSSSSSSSSSNTRSSTVSLGKHTFDDNGRTDVIYDVDRRIKGFKIKPAVGRFNVREVQISRGKKWTVNKRLEKGNSYKQTFNSRYVSRIRIKVDNAGEDTIELFVYTGGRDEWDDDDDEWDDDDDDEWDDDDNDDDVGDILEDLFN